MANDSGDGGKCPTGGTEAGDSPGEEGQLCSVALRDIFLSCDKHNAGSAHAQSLIEFVTPFLSNNVMELMCLKNCLDPNNDNPLITEDQFFLKMQVWISKIKTMSVSPEKKGNFEAVSFHQFSTHESKSCTQLLKNSAESGLLNLSGASSTSMGNAFQEIASLQEVTHELEHQNRKLQEELALVKSQLAASEEQNEMLQSDLRKINTKLLAEQHLNGQLHVERRENEELRECSEGLRKKIELLEKSFSCVERENGNIRQKLELLEQENQKLEDKLEQARNREIEKEKSIITMRTEYDFKEAVIASLEKAVLEMQEKLKENQQVIEHHIEINEGLKVEKITLEKLLRGQLSQSYTIPSTPPNPLTSSSSGTNFNNTPNTYSHVLHQKQQSNLFSNFSVSPFAAFIQHEANIFNSPKLKGMLENPVSPNLSRTSSQLNKSLDSSALFDKKIEEIDAVKNDQIPFHPEPKMGESTFFKNYRLVGEPEPALSTTHPLPQKSDKLRQPKSKDAELKAAIGDSPLKNNSNTSVFLQDTSSEDDLLSKIPLTESAIATQHSLLYELSQVNKDNEVNNNSKNILDQMQQENDDLKKRLDVCTEELERLKKELELAKENETETSEENTNLRNEVKLLTQEKIDLKRLSENSSSYVQELEVKLKRIVKHEEMLACEIKELKEQKNILNKTIADNEEKNKNLIAELNKLKQSLQLKECAAENLEHEHLRLLDSYDDLKKEYDELKNISDKEATKENLELKIAIAKKEETISELKHFVHSLTEEICNYNKSFEEKETVIKQLEKDVESLKEIQSELERKIIQKDANENDLKTKISKLKKFVEDNEKSITYLTTFSSRLSEQISIKEDIEMMLRREVSKLDQVLNEKEDAVKHLENEISQIKQTLLVKDALVDQLKNYNTKMEEAFQEKDESIENFEKQVQNLSKTNEEKDTELSALYAQIEEFNTSIEKKDRSLGELSDYNAHLEESISLEKKKEIEMKESIGYLMKTVEDKEHVVENLKVVVSGLQTKLEETEKSHEKDIKEKENALGELEMLNEEAMKFGKLQEENNQLKAKLLEKEEKVKKIQQDIDFLKSELEQKEILIQNLEDDDQLEMARKVLHEKEDYIQQLNSLNGNLMNKISVMDNIVEHNKKLNMQLAEKEGLINSLKKSIFTSTTEMKTLKSQIKSLQEELNNKENATEKLRAKIKSLKDESHSVNSVLKLQKTSLENYEVQVCEMSKSIEAKNSDLESLSHDLNQLKESSKEKDVTFAYLQKDFKELENRYQQKITEVEELTTLLISKEKTIEKLKDKNHQFHVSLKENEETVARLETETARLNEQLTFLSKIHSDAQEHKSPKSGRCSYDRLIIKVEKSQEKIDSLQRQLEEEKKHTKSLLDENSELSKEICKLNEANFGLKKELEQLKNRDNNELLAKESPDSPSGDVCLTSQHTMGRRSRNVVTSSEENEIDQSVSGIIPNLKNTLPMLTLYCEKTPAEKSMVREKFETLVLTLTVDASTIMDRVERQKSRLVAMEDSIATEAAKLLDLLDEVKCQNEDPFVANRIVLCIEQVNVVTDVASKTVMTAMKAGSLQQEQNFIHSMCTLINYVSDVQRDLDSVTSRLEGLNKRKSFFGRFPTERCRRMLKSSVFRIFYRLCAATIFIYVVTVIVATCLGDEGLCSPFITVSYGHGPRPV